MKLPDSALFLSTRADCRRDRYRLVGDRRVPLFAFESPGLIEDDPVVCEGVDVRGKSIAATVTRLAGVVVGACAGSDRGTAHDEDGRGDPSGLKTPSARS